jgi:hypothetical protein
MENWKNITKSQNSVRKKSFGGTFIFSNCHIIRLDTGSLLLIVFVYFFCTCWYIHSSMRRTLGISKQRLLRSHIPRSLCETLDTYNLYNEFLVLQFAVINVVANLNVNRYIYKNI